MTDDADLEDIEAFRLRARAWLADNMPQLGGRAGSGRHERGPTTGRPGPGCCSARCSTAASPASASRRSTAARA